MKERTSEPLRAVCFVAASLFIPLTGQAVASDTGDVAVAMVSEAWYRHFMDDVLYTHTGDDRGYGPEHDLARANIVALFESYGLATTLECGVYAGRGYCNVVGTKLGITYPDQEYILGAHYDSVGNPGADDNASGVALTLEAARVLSPFESDYTIRFIAFDREEDPPLYCYGSRGYLATHSGDDIRGMISADMVAWDRGVNFINVICESASAGLQNDLMQSTALYGDGLDYTPVHDGRSDYVPFHQAGYPACMMIEQWGPNPNFHTPLDTVDTPDYISYEFAIRIVRSIVGFLVDHAGVHIDVPNPDYDGDGDVDMDDFAEFELCFGGAGVPATPPCDFFDLDGDGDVDCTDWMLFKAVWTEPGDPPVHWPCRLLPPETVESPSPRSLVVTPPEHGMPLALLVTGDPDDPDVSCMSQAEGQRHYVRPDGVVVQTDDPNYQTYDAWGTVIVRGAQIIPSTGYKVWCDYGEAGLSPIGVYTTTGFWGDVVGDFVDGSWTPPDGDVNFMDIYSVVEAFRNLPTAPPISCVDLVGQSGSECTPDAAIDFLDISAAVEAFKGLSYTETTGCPAPCE